MLKLFYYNLRIKKNKIQASFFFFIFIILVIHVKAFKNKFFDSFFNFITVSRLTSAIFIKSFEFKLIIFADFSISNCFSISISIKDSLDVTFEESYMRCETQKKLILIK